uniref:Uncharacterized protein n=1 Tax=Setaria italica TaxID=4555 RepID=K3XTU2_SETIT
MKRQKNWKKKEKKSEAKIAFGQSCQRISITTHREMI